MIRNNQNGRRRGRGGARPPQQGGGPSGNYGNPNGGGSRIDTRQRGNATQLLEKYKTMARDATQNGDRVQAEFYMQYADHYFRVLSEFRARDPQPAPRSTYDDEDDDGAPGYANAAPGYAGDDGDDDRSERGAYGGGNGDETAYRGNGDAGQYRSNSEAGQYRGNGEQRGNRDQANYRGNGEQARGNGDQPRGNGDQARGSGDQPAYRGERTDQAERRPDDRSARQRYPDAGDRDGQREARRDGGRSDRSDGGRSDGGRSDGLRGDAGRSNDMTRSDGGRGDFRSPARDDGRDATREARSDGPAREFSGGEPGRENGQRDNVQRENGRGGTRRAAFGDGGRSADGPRDARVAPEARASAAEPIIGLPGPATIAAPAGFTSADAVGSTVATTGSAFEPASGADAGSDTGVPVPRKRGRPRKVVAEPIDG